MAPKVVELSELAPLAQVELRDKLVRLLAQFASIYELTRHRVDELEDAIGHAAYQVVIGAPPPTNEDLAQLQVILEREVLEEGANFLQQLRLDLAMANAPIEVFRWACADLPPGHPAWRHGDAGLSTEIEGQEPPVVATEDVPHGA
jgi:hypothetical protein